MYSFGAYTGSRRELKCQCNPAIQMNISDLNDIPPWWSEDNSNNGNWPKKPDTVVYKRVHLFNSEVAPWCTYAMVYDSTVAASTLTSKDLEKFQYRKTRYEFVLGKEYKSKMKGKQYLELRDMIQYFLSYVQSVVPKQSMENCLSE